MSLIFASFGRLLAHKVLELCFRDLNGLDAEKRVVHDESPVALRRQFANSKGGELQELGSILLADAHLDHRSCLDR